MDSALVKATIVQTVVLYLLLRKYKNQKHHQTIQFPLLHQVKIDENNYLYNNTKYSVENIDQLIDELNKNTDSIVKIVENEASLKAYNTLIDRLNENKISYIDYTIGKGETTE